MYTCAQITHMVALYCVYTHTGGVGWGKGRLHGAEAQQMAELLLQVKEMLADEL
jgi:hypothetical protein